jgi:hypothetical protein
LDTTEPGRAYLARHEALKAENERLKAEKTMWRGRALIAEEQLEREIPYCE